MVFRTLILLALLALAVRAEEPPAPAILSARPLAPEVGRYECLELACELRLPPGTDPFDPRQVDLRATFVAPSGTARQVCGFLWQDFERRLEERGVPHNPVEVEELTPAGPPSWRVRFAPDEVGLWSYRLSLRTGEATQDGPGGEFRCVEGPASGFVRVSQADPRYLCLDNGRPFFPIGHNLCWPSRRGTFDYDDWLVRMQESGENFFRLWLMRNAACTLETPRDPDSGLGGVGRYHLGHAWRVDHVLAAAERRGLRAMLCVYDFYPFRITHTFRKQKSTPFADINPYNAALGGPVTTPQEFFTDPAARRLARRLLRYVVARYGHYRSLALWELFNEVDLVHDYRRARGSAAAWHREMAEHLRSLDPYAHPITTSFANPRGDDAVWGLAEIDLACSHTYGATDIPAFLAETARDLTGRLGKPHLFGEFGCDAEFVGQRLLADPRGIHLHNGIWASALSGGAGTALSWWWDNYIAPYDLYRHYKPLADFLADVPWITAGFAPAKVTFQALAGPGGGAVDHVHKYLHGSGHKELQKPTTLLVHFAASGRCVVGVKQVSMGGVLVARLDGRQVLRQFLPAGKGPGPWKRSFKQADHDNWVAVYDADYSFPVPAGRHTLSVENLGSDWIELSHITLVGALAEGEALPLPCGGDWGQPAVTRLQVLPDGRLAEMPVLALRCIGLKSRDRALLWVQNTEHTWERCGRGARPRPQPPARMAIPGLARGRYRVTLWDTYAGESLRTEEVPLAGGPLAVDLPAIETDLAVKAVRVGP
ncbi:MAG: DUF5060 domain-containing protein [bacterium]